MKDGTMFGNLINYVHGDYIKYVNENSFFKIYNKKCEKTYKIFLTNIINAKEEEYVYNIYSLASDNKEFENWKREIVKKYIYKDETCIKNITNTSQIVVLSTCYDNTEKRIIVVGYKLDG